MPSRSREEVEEMEVDEAPTSIDPYAVLSLSEDATQDDVKTAYRKAALQHHPDKATEESKEEAHTKFQEVAFAYAILSDERRRKRYDTTGRTEESLGLEDDDFDWASFFREQFANVVTTEAINDFEKQYKGSEEERGHLIKAYKKHEGTMAKIYEEVMLSDVLQDDERFRGIIDAAIEAGDVQAYQKYTHEPEKTKQRRVTEARKRRDKEAKEVEEVRDEHDESGGKRRGAKKKDAGTSDLAALIQQRKQGRAENFFDRLEEKYAPNGKKSGTKRSMDDPPEEAFTRNAKKGKGSKK